VAIRSNSGGRGYEKTNYEGRGNGRQPNILGDKGEVRGEQRITHENTRKKRGNMREEGRKRTGSVAAEEE
jgi:hypothetical protein